MRRAVLLVTLLSAAACSDEAASNSASGDPPDAAPPAVDAGPRPGSTTPRPGAVFEELLAHDWELEPGAEQYYCVYQKLTEDLWVSDFRPLAAPGTHHATLGMVTNGPPDGVITAGDPDAPFPCTGISLGDNLVYAAVRNTEGFSFPEGVAARIPAGKHLLLSVHVLNPDDATLRGRTGIEIVRSEPTPPERQAEAIFALNPGIVVGVGESTHTSPCTMTEDATLLSLTHHMHLTGVRQKTTIIREDGTRDVLLDEPFVFDDQPMVVLDPPVQVKKGETLEAECLFQNPGPTVYGFGESTRDSEMCLTSFYRYPAVATSFLCLQ